MFKKIIFSILLGSALSGASARADFGDADFPIDSFKDGPKSYHDAWCGKLKNTCRVRFQGKAMWVEGQGGIQRSQYLQYRYEWDPDNGFFADQGGDHYNYISYISQNGKRKEALFLFSKQKAQREFVRAFSRWESQDTLPIPNYRYPNSQGPQETHGRDKGLNLTTENQLLIGQLKQLKINPQVLIVIQLFGEISLSAWTNK